MTLYLLVQISSEVKSYGKGGEIYAVSGDLCRLIKSSLDGMNLLQKQNGYLFYTRTKNFVIYEPKIKNHKETGAISKGLFAELPGMEQKNRGTTTGINQNNRKTQFDTEGGRVNRSQQNISPAIKKEPAESNGKTGGQCSLF